MYSRIFASTLRVTVDCGSWCSAKHELGDHRNHAMSAGSCYRIWSVSFRNCVLVIFIAFSSSERIAVHIVLQSRRQAQSARYTACPSILNFANRSKFLVETRWLDRLCERFQCDVCHYKVVDSSPAIVCCIENDMPSIRSLIRDQSQ